MSRRLGLPLALALLAIAVGVYVALDGSPSPVPSATPLPVETAPVEHANSPTRQPPPTSHPAPATADPAFGSATQPVPQVNARRERTRLGPRETPAPTPSMAPADAPAPDAPPAPSAAADPDSEIMRDMDQVGLMLRDFRTRMGENPWGTNAEIMKAVMGANPAGAILGPPEGQFLNGDGELVDRWGTPYFFHQMSKNHMEIHSAGPDKRRGTEDDVIYR